MNDKTMPERIWLVPSELSENTVWTTQEVEDPNEPGQAAYIRADLTQGDPGEQLAFGHISLRQAIYIQCKLIEMTGLADELLSSKAKTYLENIDFEQTSVYNYYIDPRAYSENNKSINSLQAAYKDALYFTEQYEAVQKALTDIGGAALPERQAGSFHDEDINKFPTTRPPSDHINI